MIDIVFIPVAVIYLSVVSMLFLYGINFFYLTYITLRTKEQVPRLPAIESWPRVTIQLPIYNELYVAQRLINAAAALDYPKGLLEIQVLDDSTDETADLSRQLVQRLQGQGLDIVHLHRSERHGYKAGALAEGLQKAKGELVAIFDADFVPPQDFLRKTVPFFQDQHLAFIQTRWDHLNPRYSILTSLQSLSIDAHFMVEQFARSRAGFWFNFNGTAGIWRSAAIQDAGGWRAETLTEDLDISYRAFLQGWQAAYLPHIAVPAELPVSFSAYRRQQHRWARGSLECARKFIPQVWSSQLPVPHKLEAILHLTGYGVHLLLFSLALLYPLVLLIARQYPSLISLFNIAFIFNATAFAPTVFFIVSQRQLGRAWWRRVPAILFATVLGSGMMLNTLRAAGQILFGHRAIFERTPKFGLFHSRENWTRRRYQLQLDPIVIFEILFAVFNLVTLAFALHLHNWIIAVYAGIFGFGLLFTSGTTILQSIPIHRQHKEQRAQPEDIPPRGNPAFRKDFAGRFIMPSHDALLQESGRCLKVASRPDEHVSNASLISAVMQTVAYADVFDYPLSLAEIHRYLIGVATTRDELLAATRSARLVPKTLYKQDVLYSLPGREALFAIRQRRMAAAARLWPLAIRYGKRISRLPFVRMVSVTGALAVDNVEPSADLDYMIITEPGRLWLCRAAVILLVRWAALQGTRICPNYFLSLNALAFKDRNLYTAHEIVQMVPISGLGVYNKIRQLNAWTADYLPNAHQPHKYPIDGDPMEPGGRLRYQVEALLRLPPGAWFERWEMRRKIRRFARWQDRNGEADFCADWCKGHFDGHAQRTLAAYALRLRALEIPFVGL